MAPPTGDPLAILTDGEPGPLYFIYGKERFLVDRAVAILKERVLDPRTRDFNYDSVYAKETPAAKIPPRIQLPDSSTKSPRRRSSMSSRP